MVKIQGVKHYLWLIVDAETRFVLGFHLSSRRDSPQAFMIIGNVNEVRGRGFSTQKVYKNEVGMNE